MGESMGEDMRGRWGCPGREVWVNGMSDRGYGFEEPWAGEAGWKMGSTAAISPCMTIGHHRRQEHLK